MDTCFSYGKPLKFHLHMSMDWNDIQNIYWHFIHQLIKRPQSLTAAFQKPFHQAFSLESGLSISRLASGNLLAIWHFTSLLTMRCYQISSVQCFLNVKVSRLQVSLFNFQGINSTVRRAQPSKSVGLALVGLLYFKTTSLGRILN